MTTYHRDGAAAAAGLRALADTLERVGTLPEEFIAGVSIQVTGQDADPQREAGRVRTVDALRDALAPDLETGYIGMGLYGTPADNTEQQGVNVSIFCGVSNAEVARLRASVATLSTRLAEAEA